jgi:hypothetical protein
MCTISYNELTTPHRNYKEDDIAKFIPKLAALIAFIELDIADDIASAFYENASFANKVGTILEVV